MTAEQSNRKRPILDRNADTLLAVFGFLVALPAMYFFTGSFLKYEMNLLGGVEIFVPPPTVMIGGLLVAITANFYPLFRQKFHKTDRAPIFCQIIQTRPWNVMMFLLGTLFLMLLLGYVLFENLAELRHVATAL